MRSLWPIFAVMIASALLLPTSAGAGIHCPPGTYIARYSFGIWYCKQPSRVRLACPPGRRLGSDHLGTPKCVRH